MNKDLFLTAVYMIVLMSLSVGFVLESHRLNDVHRQVKDLTTRTTALEAKLQVDTKSLCTPYIEDRVLRTTQYRAPYRAEEAAVLNCFYYHPVKGPGR